MHKMLAKAGLRETEDGAECAGRIRTGGRVVPSVNPATGAPLAAVRLATRDSYEQVIERSARAFETWRSVPPPRRGAVVREIGEALRKRKEEVAQLITLEVGKITSESLGEVQEAIDMADYAVGLSRMLGGSTLPSERPDHRMFEQWHPLGPVGVITAFNFPCAVWAWNAFVALVCGDTVIWKPSLKAPLTALLLHRICDKVLTAHGFEGVLGLVIGDDDDVGEALVSDPRVPLISATGSCRMGRQVAPKVAARLGRCLLELGGNNALIVDETANLDLAVRAITFGAVGTAGQRCTTTRRLFAKSEIADALCERLAEAFLSLPIGDPIHDWVLVGPLVDGDAVVAFEETVEIAIAQGGEVLCGGNRIERAGTFVEPTLIRAGFDLPVASNETFAPILYVSTWDTLDDVIGRHNAVSQGLSSAYFTDSLRRAERFLSTAGSDCGIANINIGTSGAEIGGAFGGEKDSGGGREAGSDSWKSYMRRQTCTINWGTALPLAQGVRFEPAAK